HRALHSFPTRRSSDLDGEVTGMGEVRGNQVQVPAPEIRASVPERGADALAHGIAAGREWARKASQRTMDWIEGHPGEALLVAVGDRKSTRLNSSHRTI